MTKKVPVLGSEGWLSNPSQKLEKLYQQAFVADRSQSNLYFGNVFSVQAVISDTPNNIDEITRNLAISFREYLSRYFDDVDVIITDSKTDSAASVRSLDVDITATDGDTKVSLGSTLSFNSSGNAQTDIRELLVKG